MSKIELKEQIYKLFSEGKTPEEVVEELNIPDEKRMVSGCYGYYKSHKKEIEAQSKFSKIQEEKEKYGTIIDECLQSIENIKKEVNNLIEMQGKMSKFNCENLASSYGSLRQYLLHYLEFTREEDFDFDQWKTRINLVNIVRREIKTIQILDEELQKYIGNFKNASISSGKILNRYGDYCGDEDSCVDRFMDKRMDTSLRFIPKEVIKEIKM